MKTSLFMTLAAGTLFPALALGQSSDSTDRAYAAELLADANARTSMLAAAGNAGWEKGKFFISDATGNNSLWMGGTIQFRYVANVRQDVAAPDEDFTHGFENPRTRIRAGGSIYEKALTYKFEADFSRNGGAPTLLDAEGKYTWDNGVAVRWGQYKAPMMREELVSDNLLLAADRSAYHAAFTLSRTQGVELSWQGESFRIAGMINDGAGALNTPFNATGEADFGITGRAEWMWAGNNWKRFDDFTSWKGEEGYAGMAGFAAHYQSGGETGGPTADMDMVQVSGDVSVEGNGWNAHASATYRNTEAAGSPDLDAWGVLVQAGVFISDQWELFARYDGVFADNGGAGDDGFNTVTFGTNYFVSPNSHAAKFVADVCYYLDDVAGSSAMISPNGRLGLLSDAEGDQVAFRAHFQIIF
ncbi:MAG: hypothetical protein HUU18_03920 [Phycisphaerales bacterium]|nr:hypothetical protein [Phycisphaerales bacterium]